MESSDALQRLTDLPWIDAVGIGVVALMLLLGALRGLWWQVVRLLGLVAAAAVARALTPSLAPRLAEVFPDLPGRVGFGVVWLVVFLAGLAAATLLGVVGRRLLDTMKLGLLDRTGGAVVGVVTGAVVHLAIVAALCQFAPNDWVQSEVSGSLSGEALDTVGARWEVLAGPLDPIGELRGVLDGDGSPTGGGAKATPGDEAGAGRRVR